MTHGLQISRLLCPWDSPSKNTGVDSHSLLQGIFLTQGWNPGIWPYRQILYCMSHEDSPKIMSIHWRFCILNVPYRILLCNAMVVSLVQLHHPVMSDFCNPMDCIHSRLPVHHQLPELSQTHIHRVGDAIQPSHPL